MLRIAPITFENAVVLRLRVVPITFEKAGKFVRRFHRHNKVPTGCKFCIGVDGDGRLCGVAMCGRPVARHFDDGFTLEINRTCTDGTKNANSCLYGACRATAKAMGYRRVITYTQANEDGGSLRASGFVVVKALKARKSWAESSSSELAIKRDRGFGGVARTLWEIRFGEQ